MALLSSHENLKAKFANYDVVHPREVLEQVRLTDLTD